MISASAKMLLLMFLGNVPSRESLNQRRSIFTIAYETRFGTLFGSKKSHFLWFLVEEIKFLGVTIFMLNMGTTKTDRKFEAGQAVEVQINLGHVLGLEWRNGYEFLGYEEGKTTVLVKHTRGLFAGEQVRYELRQVRSAGKR